MARGDYQGEMWDEKLLKCFFSPLFSLLTDRQTKGKAPRVLLRGYPPQGGDACFFLC